MTMTVKLLFPGQLCINYDVVANFTKLFLGIFHHVHLKGVVRFFLWCFYTLIMKVTMPSGISIFFSKKIVGHF